MPNNEMQWSSAHPGLIIFLLDQSGSMTNEYVNGENRSEFACKAINNLIDNVIQRNYNGDKPKNRVHIAVLGYSDSVDCLVSGYLSELDDMDVEVYDDYVPKWINPIYNGGTTNMKAAFEMAKDIINKWVETCPDNPAPVIINISDGEPYFDQLDVSECMQQTKNVVDEIKAIYTKDGNVQIFNVMIGNGDDAVKFPINTANCENEESKFIYEISTQVPESYRIEAKKKHGIECEKGARGVIYQANDKDLVDLINFGSTLA